MRIDAALLLCAAIFTQSASAAGRRDVLNFGNKRFYPSSNSTWSASSSGSTPADPTSYDKAPPSSSTSSVFTSGHGSIGANSSSATTSSSIPSSALNSTSLKSVNSTQQTSASPQLSARPANTTITTSSPYAPGPVVSITIKCPINATASVCTAPPTRVGNMTTDYTRPIATATGECTSIPDNSTKLITEFSVVYTSTVTFYGNRADYTPPFETLVTPNYCPPTFVPWLFTGVPAPKILPSGLLPAPSRKPKELAPALRPVVTFITTDKNPSVVFPTEPVPAYTPSAGLGGSGGNPDNGDHKTADNGGSSGGDPRGGSSGGGSSGGGSSGGGSSGGGSSAGGSSGGGSSGGGTSGGGSSGGGTSGGGSSGGGSSGGGSSGGGTSGGGSSGGGSSGGGSSDGGSSGGGSSGGGTSGGGTSGGGTSGGGTSGGGSSGGGSSGGGSSGGGSSGGGSSGGGSHHIPDAESIISKGPPPTFKVTARGTQVIINDETFSDLGPSQTSVVTVGGGTFTIYPTAILGEGATVRKPAPAGTAVSIATPTTSVVGGLPVTITGSEAIVGGVTVTIPEQGTTTVVNGQHVSIGPGTLVVGGEILSFDAVMPARETDVLINGGELLTAIGRSVVVIHSTTFTYGPGIPEMTEVVNGETISIGPSGIMVHGMVMGGPSADTSTTNYEIVGGVTISRIAPSIAVINGVMFTVGPGTHWTTTVIAGETFTIGPTGVIASTMTLTYPFGSAVTTTIAPTGTWLNDFPVETAAHHDADEDNGGSLLRPDLCVGWVAVCIAIGVLLLG